MSKAARKTAFKVGFLCKLAELGVTPSELYKASDSILDLIPNPLGGSVDAASGAVGKGFEVASKALPYALAAGVGLPLAAGTATGVAAGKMTSPISESIDDLRKKELIETYRRLAAEIKSRGSRQIGGL